MEIGKPPWCCPRQAEFWRLGCTSWCATFLSAECGMRSAELPKCTAAYPHSALRIPHLNRSRPMPFQQRTNTSCYLAIPTHGFTVVLSVFGGTPPAKPLNCKSVSNRLGARIRSVWAHHTGGTPRHSCDRFRLALSDIIKTSFSFHSQCFAFRYRVHFVFRFCVGKQKTLLPFR